MKIKHFYIFISLFLLPLLHVSTPVFANVNPLQDICAQNPSSSVCREDQSTRGESARDNEVINTLASVVRILMFGIGAASVIAVIVGGILYAISAGDPQKALKARNTIFYALIGLTVAALSQLIIGFVLDRL